MPGKYNKFNFPSLRSIITRENMAHMNFSLHCTTLPYYSTDSVVCKYYNIEVIVNTCTGTYVFTVNTRT